MLLEVSETMRGRLALAERLMMEVVTPLEPRVAAEGFEACQGALEEARAAVKEAGLWAPFAPSEHGGLGLPFLEQALLGELLGRSPIGHYCFNCQAPDAGNVEVLHEHGTAEQKARWLDPLVAGELRSCFSMTEPDRAGSNPTWMDTTATLEGDEWVVNGRKWFTTAADGAAFAIVMAVTEPEGPAHARASMILVPTDTPGFRHVRRLSVMGEEGSGWASHSEIAYEGCRVPEANLIGQRGMGFIIAQQRLGPGRIHHCMRWLGIAERALELMCQRAVAREIAPGKPLATRQAIQHWVAEARARIDAARLYVQHTARRIDAEGLYEARVAISCVKFLVADVLSETLDRAIQVHGALGMTDDTPLAWFWRHERGAHIYDGPDEVHKTAVARRVLRSHGFELGSQGR